MYYGYRTIEAIFEGWYAILSQYSNYNSPESGILFQKPLLVILGPTGVGKTDLAIEIAQAIHGEILSADSRQIYRHMDIGTAKPTKEQQSYQA